MRARRVLFAVGTAALAVLVACGGAPERQALAPPVGAPAEVMAAAPLESTVPAPAPVPTVMPDLPGAEGAATPRVPRAPRAAGAPRPSGPQVTGRIEIPKIGLSHTTYEGVSLAVLKYGPGHWPGTPMPGHTGNSVFPGHRTTHSRPFWDADKLQPGDQIIFTTAEGRFVYEVFDSIIVRANEMWVVDQTSDARLTIFGCHPKGRATHRYVVRSRLVGAPISNAPQASAKPSPATTAPPPAQQPPATSAPTTTAPPRNTCLVCLG
jgi:sortase A